MRTAVYCVLLFAVGAVNAPADPLYALGHIGRSDGLSQSSVRAVAVDKLGFLWIGTETGVERYDGYRFKHITPPFGHGIVQSLHVDSRGRLWIHWYGHPVTLYDPTRGQWRVLDGAGVAADLMDGFLEDPHGTIWLSNGSALSYYDERLQRPVAVAALPFTPIGPEDMEPHLDVNRLFWQPIAWYDNVVWVGAQHELVGFDTIKKVVVHRIKMPSLIVWRLWVYRGSLWLCNPSGVSHWRSDGAQWEALYHDPAEQVSACEFGADGALWIGTRNAGAIRILNGIEQHFRQRDADPSSLAGNSVLNIQRDSRGELWVITPGVVHRWLGGQFERFVHSPDSQLGNLGGAAVAQIVEDDSGVLWLGTEGSGLAKLSRFARKARLLVPPSRINPHVRTPVVDRDGNVWMGMNQDGVFRWNRADDSWTHFAADANTQSQLPTPEVRAVLAPRDGTIWAGSRNGGTINRYDPATGAWKRVATGQDSMILNFRELPDGHIIIGRLSSVTEFDPATLQSRHYPSPDSSAFRASVLSRSGHVFFGTHPSGVVEFIPGRGFARTWKSQLSDPNVFSIYEDRTGMLWVGTWGGGLDRLDPESGKVQVIATQEGLPDNSIYGILPGKHNDLWVSTSRGLARIENCLVPEWPCRPTISVLDGSNGLPISEFNSEAAARAPNGELFFGGDEGLLYFDPDKIELNRRAPHLQFSAVLLNDDELAPFWLPAADSTTPRLELQHHFGTLKVEFSALDFHASINNRYRYRLSSTGKWLPLGGDATLSLSNLDPGRYALEIMGANNDGVWSEKPLTLAIHVLTPWYRHPLALLTYGALLAAAMAALIKWRERRLRANNFHLEATVAARTRELAAANSARDEFYANISHEIRTPLTLLAGTAEALKKNPDPRQDMHLADDLLRHSESLRRYVESLITVSHLNSSSTIAWLGEDLAAYLRGAIADFQRVAGSRTITLDLAEGPCLVRSYANALDTIFSNLLINAIRHTPNGGVIAVTVSDQGGCVTVAIVDSGSGIDPHLSAALFERGRRGASAAPSAVGHGIGLNLVKQTVLALQGTIDAHNADDGGACFTITLPRADPGLPVAPIHRASFAVTTPRPTLGERLEDGDLAGKKVRGRILVIEDHAELRAHLVGVFSVHYRVREAATAAGGLADAKAYLPDLVICDVMLPDGQGFDVLTALRSDPITDHIGVILLTALADDASRRHGLTAEADLYVTKPFQHDEFEVQVANLMNQRRRIRRAAAQDLWREKMTTGDTKRSPRRESFESRLLAALETLHSSSACTIETIAKHLAMSRKQLERKTHYCFQCSPKVLLNRYRLDKAVILLRQGVRILEVAERCGFGSQSHFGALFKKRFGYAPSKEKAEMSQF
jgi:signal transduction histidine kinase/ligand-binding sensor domain-containing protein/DNA-binding response OmpR family regulator